MLDDPYTSAPDTCIILALCFLHNLIILSMPVVHVLNVYIGSCKYTLEYDGHAKLNTLSKSISKSDILDISSSKISNSCPCPEPCNRIFLFSLLHPTKLSITHTSSVSSNRLHSSMPITPNPPVTIFI